MNKGILITIALVAVTGIFFATTVASTTIEENPFQDRKLLQKGMQLPVIWLYVDDSIVNSRSWLDFMGRSTRAINLPFLNLCYTTIVKKNSDLYRVEVISGLSDLAVRLGGWEALPGPLQTPLAPVGEAELNWIRACVLSKWGGLWLHPSTVALRPFGALPSDKVVFFGTDKGETYSDANGTQAPGLHCIWSPRPAHPLFVQWEKLARERIVTQEGGKQFRGDEKWDVRQLAIPKEVTYLPTAELSRKPDGRRIELVDIMASGSMTFDLTADAIYLPIPLQELLRNRQLGWFLAMSEDQIIGSDLTISQLFKTANL